MKLTKKNILRLSPHRVTNDFWWYEENKGISVCIRAFDKNSSEQTFVRDIPWRAIRAALARKDKEEKD